MDKLSKMNKSQRQTHEYNILKKNYKKYNRQIELFNEKYKDDKRNIIYLNYSRFLQNKINRIEKLL